MRAVRLAPFVLPPFGKAGERYKMRAPCKSDCSVAECRVCLTVGMLASQNCKRHGRSSPLPPLPPRVCGSNSFSSA